MFTWVFFQFHATCNIQEELLFSLLGLLNNLVKFQMKILHFYHILIPHFTTIAAELIQINQNLNCNMAKCTRESLFTFNYFIAK